jgi:hypothetical protein
MTKDPRNYFPDNWVIIKINGDDPHYRVLAGWSGGYVTGDEWRMNCAITNVEFENNQYTFHWSTGSKYICHKDTYGLRMNNGHVWHAMHAQHGDKVEMMKEDTDWLKMDWILKDEK